MILDFVFIGMIMIVVIILCWPLFQQSVAPKSRLNYDLIVYRDQIKEVLRNQKEGFISKAQASLLTQEIERRVLSISKEKEPPSSHPHGPKSNKICALFLILLISLGSFFLYGYLGSPELALSPVTILQKSAETQTVETIMSASPQERQALIEKMVNQLSSKLERQPDNVEGWIRLAHAYRVLGEMEKAQKAIDRALEIKPDNIDVLMTEGEIQLAQSSSTLSEPFVTTMQKVLSLDPSNLDALYYVGEAQHEEGHDDKARLLWQKLLQELPADSPHRQDISKQLETLGD